MSDIERDIHAIVDSMDEQRISSFEEDVGWVYRKGYDVTIKIVGQKKRSAGSGQEDTE